jgi:hypothetical protein
MTGLIETSTRTPPPASCMVVAVWYACRENENENGERRGTRDVVVVVDVRAASNGGVCHLPLPVVFSLIFREIESLVPCSPPNSHSISTLRLRLRLTSRPSSIPCEVRQVWLLSLHPLPLPRFSSSSSSSSSSSFSFSSKALSTSTDSNSTEQRAGLLFGQRALLTPPFQANPLHSSPIVLSDKNRVPRAPYMLRRQHNVLN